MDAKLFEQLLYDEEGTTLDFKRDQYPFATASDDQKSELLKDIIAFANAFRRSDAYILIGVQEVRGDKSEVVGITEHLDDHSLQQFVTHRTNRPVSFSYEAFSYEDKQVGIITIEYQQRPIHLKKNYGKLSKKEVYIRRGSSTGVATHDEIAQMGAMDGATSKEAVLAIEFAEIDREHSRGTSIPWLAEFCKMPDAKKIPTLSSPRQRNQLGIDISSIQSVVDGNVLNKQYLYELANYEFVRRLFHAVRLVVTNEGKNTANDVRVECSIPKHDRMCLMKASEIPAVPKKHKSRFDISASLKNASWKNVASGIRRIGCVDINTDDEKLNYYRLKPVGSKMFREIRTEVLNSRFSNLKIVAAIIGLSSILVTNVFHNCLVGHVSA